MASALIFGIFGISNAQPDATGATDAETTAEQAEVPEETAEPNALQPEESGMPEESGEQEGGAGEMAQPQESVSAEATVEPSLQPDTEQTFASQAVLPVERDQQPIQEESAREIPQTESNAIAEDHTNPDVLDVWVGTAPDHLEKMDSSFNGNTGSNIFYEFRAASVMSAEQEKVYLKITAKDDYAGNVRGDAAVGFQVGDDSYDATVRLGEVLALDAAFFRSVAYGDYDLLQFTVSYAGVWAQRLVDGALTWEQMDGNYTYKGYLKNLFQPSEQPGKTVVLTDYIGTYGSENPDAPAIEIYQSGSAVRGRIVGELQADGTQAESGVSASSSFDGNGSLVVTLKVGYGVNAYFTVGADGTLTSQGNYAYRKAAGETAGAFSGLIPVGTVYSKTKFAAKNERTGEEYESLQKAINKAEAGDTILLGKDCEFGTTTQTGYDEDGVGYGLYGKFYKPLTIRSDEGAHTVTMTSMLTVTADTTFANVVVEGGKSNSFVIKENSTLTLEGGAVLQHLGSSGVQVGENMATSGTLVMKEGSAVMGNAKDGVKLMGNGTLIMDGGEISNCNGVTTNQGGSGYGVTVAGGHFTMNGGTISGNSGFAGGGVQVTSSIWATEPATFVMNGGTITGNSGNGTTSASVCLQGDGCSVTINGGAITGNTGGSNQATPGVSVTGEGVFTMNGGEISGNTSGRNNRAAAFYMTKGTVVLKGNAKITGNVSNDTTARMPVAGIYMTGGSLTVTDQAQVTENTMPFDTGAGGIYMSNGSLNISGNAQVTGNTKNGAPSNVVLTSGKSIDVTGIGSAARIGVTPYRTTAGTLVATADDGQSMNMENFVPDGTEVSFIGLSGKAVVGIPTTVSADGLEKDVFIAGTAPTVELQGLTVKKTDGTVIPGAAVTLLYYTDDNGQPGTQIAVPSEKGTYWVRAKYDGNASYYYGESVDDTAYSFRIVPGVESVSLDRAALVLEKGADAQLTATVLPEDAANKTVAWSTSNAAVAAVENGKVTAVGSGAATITAEAGGKKAICEVTVSVPSASVAVTSVTLSNSAISLDMGSKGRLVAFVKPDAATDKGLTWSSSDPQVLEVDQTGLLLPVAPGTATVTARSANEKMASCTVTVMAQPETKPVVPGMGGKEQVVVEPEMKNGKIDSDTVREAISSAKPEEVVVIKVDAKDSVNANVDASIVDAVANGSQAVVFATTGEDGKILATVTLDLSLGVAPEELKDINLGFTNEVSTEVAEQAKNSVPEGASILFIQLAHDGEFPCPVTRMDYVGGNFAPGSNVYLYWIDPTGGLCEEQELAVDENGYITYTISHASPYAVSSRRMEAATIAPPTAGGSDNPGGTGTQEPDDPGTGRPDNNGGDSPGVTGGDTKPVDLNAGDSEPATAPKTDDGQDLLPYLFLAALMGSVAAVGAGLVHRRRKRG